MATADDNPAGYYVGRPVNYDEQKAPAPPAKKAVDEQVNPPVQGVLGYYAARVGQGTETAGDQSSADAHREGEPGFLSKCFICFYARGNAR